MLILVRHGESTGNANRLLLGRLDVPLTDRGLAEARAVGAMLGPVVRLLASPLQRARDTAEALGLGLPVEVDGRWIEVDYGEHDGQPLAASPGELWQRWRADPSHRPRGGESLTEVGHRVADACASLFARDGAGARRADGDVVVVSHVSPIKAAVAWALGVEECLAWRLHLSTGSVTVVGWGADAPVLHAFNRVPRWAPGDGGGSAGR